MGAVDGIPITRPPLGTDILSTKSGMGRLVDFSWHSMLIPKFLRSEID